MNKIYFLKGILFLCFNNALSTHFLIKIPTRTRPDVFFNILNKFYDKLSGKTNTSFLIACDENDTTMNNQAVRKKLNSYPNLDYIFSNNSSKVEAYNKDLNNRDFDIVLLAADDMEPAVKGYDQIIIDTMQKYFPDYDGVLNFNDGHVGPECNTIPIIGKKFYDRFGYAYYPGYKSLFCDSEITRVSRILGKEFHSNDVIIKHNHPSFQNAKLDALYVKNNKFWAQDQKLYFERWRSNFNIDDAMLNSIFTKTWSILICTLEKRKKSFEFIYNKIKQQIKKNKLEDKIEVLYFSDNGEHTVGYKRNELHRLSKGLYVNFLDDDDDIHDDYIKMIYEKIQKKPDCISLTGIITTNGKNPKKFIHSLKYNTFFEKNKIYYRPPNHLNTMKRCIAAQYLFPEKNFGEDSIWAMKIAKSDLLKTEEEINIPYYFYLFVTNKKA